VAVVVAEAVVAAAHGEAAVVVAARGGQAHAIFRAPAFGTEAAGRLFANIQETGRPRIADRPVFLQIGVRSTIDRT
jgi:hypothetical protein